MLDVYFGYVASFWINTFKYNDWMQMYIRFNLKHGRRYSVKETNTMTLNLDTQFATLSLNQINIFHSAKWKAPYDKHFRKLVRFNSSEKCRFKMVSKLSNVILTLRMQTKSLKNEWTICWCYMYFHANKSSVQTQFSIQFKNSACI